ncbi:alpha/beta fold hydrolase [Microlunatus parietis]|uniref:Pimeloyl-ACP methyl ester carboxylesterase n=1 Tax=Microlunatus parietis TaxID=682979 RepID=A0A7Y9I5W6_9ACTN|nr:alpha/beta hydrolase [Microlunatus parietis]NYE70782.1 pimeloyl-ACP methyl ester carboxylesterase [Microlunatus parietis]
MSEPKSFTLDVPGAVLHYDVRESDSTEPPLLLIGSPMDAVGFTTLAGHFADRTVVTYDPRAAGRSRRTDGAARTTPDEHADDLHRLIDAVGGGPVDIFASSGGAVNGLVLAARHPEQVRTLVAHEPPATQVLPDRAAALAAVTDINETYLKSGMGPAMAKFIMLVSHQGEIPADFPQWPVDPTQFGLPTEDDGTRDDALLGQNMIDCNYYEHDFDALRAAPARIVVAVGEKTGAALPRRTGEIVAERIGQRPVIFPGDHGAFMGGEYGMPPGEPDAFAAKLREVLAG